jgi:predicted RNA binding protein YcfA (HicA-like mRNA interferase family)
MIAYESANKIRQRSFGRRSWPLWSGIDPLGVKFRDIVKMVEADGWRVVAQGGSHRQYKHPTKPGKVTIAGHPSVAAAPKTLKSILEQAGLKR